MACFIVPMGEAVVTTVVQKVVEKREKKTGVKGTSRISWSRKLSWLNKLLWGGVLLLALEHIWCGEVVLWPPFLTAMNHPDAIGPMLHEIGTIGVGMALFITVVWVVMVLYADLKVKKIPVEVKTDA